MRQTLRPIFWLGSSLGDVRAFPRESRQAIGRGLRLIQKGLKPNSWKPMASVGPGVRELRVQIKGAYRVLFVTRYEEGVYVLHAFQKRTRKTGRLDIELGRRRLRNLEIGRTQGT